MRKWIAYLLTALFLAVSCVSELEQGGSAVDASLEGAPVTITFSVPDIPVLPATKTLEDGDGDITGTPYLDPEKMYLVVCGSSQSIKYIRKATLKEIIPDFVIPEDKYPLAEGDRHTTLYKFSVQLELSDFARTIHILGNVDENQLITGSYSYQSLPGMLSFDNKQAYWQKLSVPYIKAKIDPDTHEPVKQDGHYVPDDETLGFFQYVPLIRNFAKIQVTNASENFQLHSYAVIYYPERGSVVPYRTNEPVAENRFDFNPPTGYIFSGYEKSSFEQLEEDINYLGNMPASVALSDVIPPASEFVDPSQSGGRVLLYDENDTESGFYVYERGIPNDHIGPTFIIVCGKFNNEDNYYYYRLDLMESKVENNQTISRYYPIYRNFRYNIQLHRISSEGVLTPEAAANSSGAEDISADVSMRHLSDISNGTTRLVVEPFMTRTYSGPAEEGSYYELYARFFNDVYSDVPNLNTAAVRVELVPMEGGEDDILILYDGNGNRVPTRGFFFPEAATVGGVEGIRTIRFNTVEPLDETKMQKIKITGHNPGNHQDLRLYREVEITLQKKQPLAVTCENQVPLATGTPLTVDITIPSELPESMFPLEFIVEPEDRTLTPDTSHDEINLPVHSGRSIATTGSADKDAPTFYFIRTLTWEEYSHLPVNEGQRTFYCYFKTNQSRSATTIWVANEYFYTGNASFINYISFRDSQFTTPIPRATDSTVEVSTNLMIEEPPYMRVHLDLKGLVPAEGSGIEWDSSTGLYTYQPTSASMNFQFKTTVDDGDVSVTLTSEDGSYVPVVLTPWHFSEAKVMDMATLREIQNGVHTGSDYANVVAGHVNSKENKNLFIGYFTDAAAPRPKTTIKDLRGVVANGNTTWDDPGPISSTAQELYREKWLKTQAGMDPISLTLSAVGYVEEPISAPRFKGAIYSYTLNSANDWNTLVNSDSPDDGDYNYRFQKTITVNEYPEKGTFTFGVTGDKPIQAHGSPTDGIVLSAGGHYEIEVNFASDHNDVFLFYNQLFYYVDNGTVLKPSDSGVVSSPDGSIYYGYPGNNLEYIWSLPYGQTGGKLVIDAPTGNDIVLNRFIIRGFHGILTNTGDTGGGDIDLGEGLNDGGSL